MQSGQQFEITVNDQKLVCWKWGAGPAVIFAHGWNGRGIQFYPFFDKLIKKGFSVVTFDGPGHGESEGKTSSYFQMTDAVRALINHLSPDKIQGIVGHSFGASATINSLSKEKIQIPVVLIAPAIKLKEMLQKTIQIHGVPNIIFKSLITEYEKKYGYHFHNDNPYNLLKTFNLNALILHDSEDPVTPFSVSQKSANLYDSINFTATNGLGHIRILKDDAVINKTIAYLNTFNSENDSDLNGSNKIKNKEFIIHSD
jgi:pimeloyl-ACP methyl ester carboxylesterase